jgi:DNA invertase Pin-like site-specific DNA recombinase
MDERPLAYSYIRLSTEPQTRGHGRQRQLEQSAAYAEKHGLRLADDGEPFEDVMSAFRGAHLRQGKFGRFVERAKSGHIRAGSYLLVESLDRISREELRKSLRVFLDILDAGINLVTLQDEQVYTANDSTLDQFVRFAAHSSRGHNESFTKSNRLLKSWANKRANIHEKKLTALCPGWLRLCPDGKNYEVIEERAAVIKSIFEDTAKGVGTHALVRKLNSAKTPTFGRSNWWHRSYILKILKNRAVLGEFQPCRMVDGKKRKAVGEPIQAYFPHIIQEDLFRRAEHSRANRRKSGRGRKGDYFTNLFSGVASCWYCRSRMIIENKGPSPKGGRYLVCSAAREGEGCIRAGWRYEHFELSFLSFIEQLDLPNVLGESDPEMKQLQETLRTLQAHEFSIKRDMDIAWEAREERQSRFLGEKISELERQYEAVQERLKQTKVAIESLESARLTFDEGRNQLKLLTARLRDQTRKREDLYEDRSLVADRIKAIADDIEIASEGGSPLVEGRVRYVNPKRANSQRHGVFITDRFFLVTFKDHSTLGVHPDKDDPYNIEGYQFFETSQPRSVT